MGCDGVCGGVWRKRRVYAIRSRGRGRGRRLAGYCLCTTQGRAGAQACDVVAVAVDVTVKEVLLLLLLVWPAGWLAGYVLCVCVIYICMGMHGGTVAEVSVSSVADGQCGRGGRLFRGRSREPSNCRWARNKSEAEAGHWTLTRSYSAQPPRPPVRSCWRWPGVGCQQTTFSLLPSALCPLPSALCPRLTYSLHSANQTRVTCVTHLLCAAFGPRPVSSAHGRLGATPCRLQRHMSVYTY